MSAFEYSALWGKSKMFVDRALSARDNGDDLDFHLWAALALEVLGKATLSKVHPSLVADPSHLPSLLAANGIHTTPNLKSIGARTVFERLRAIVSRFDERMVSECTLMANRRNAELHSGETPMVGLAAGIWVPYFWRAIELLINEQNRSLADWLGTEEAARVQTVLDDNAALLRQTVLARMARRMADFDSRYPVGSAERVGVATIAAARALPARYFGQADTFEEYECPACTMKGWLFGSFREEEVVDGEGYGDPDMGYSEWVQRFYDVEQFRGSECGLGLEGRDEIESAGLPLELEDEEEREPNYAPEYGNE